jgi:hypothetical protein
VAVVRQRLIGLDAPVEPLRAPRCFFDNQGQGPPPGALYCVNPRRDQPESEGSMTEPTDSMTSGGDTRSGLDRATAILVEIADAVRSAALCAAGQQVQRSSRQVGGMAEAMRAAACSLDRSQSPTAARVAHRAAGRIEGFSRSLHERRWGDIIDEVEGVARRRPALFVLGTVAVGFLAGRLLLDPRPQDKSRQPPAVGEPPPDKSVEAAVSSAAGNGLLASGIHQGLVPRENP